MGNHDVGKAFEAVIEALGDRVEAMSSNELLAVLDSVGNKFRGLDADFDVADEPSEPLGRVLVRAFLPEGLPPEPEGDEWSNPDDWERWNDLWNERVNKPFRQRYDFW